MTEIFVTADASKDELLRKLEVHSALAPSGFTLTMEPGGAQHLIEALRAQDAYREAREIAIDGISALDASMASLHAARERADIAADRVQWAFFIAVAVYTALSMVLA